MQKKKLLYNLAFVCLILNTPKLNCFTIYIKNTANDTRIPIKVTRREKIAAIKKQLSNLFTCTVDQITLTSAKKPIEYRDNLTIKDYNLKPHQEILLEIN